MVEEESDLDGFQYGQMLNDGAMLVMTQTGKVRDDSDELRIRRHCYRESMVRLWGSGKSVW